MPNEAEGASDISLKGDKRFQNESSKRLLLSASNPPYAAARRKEVGRLIETTEGGKELFEVRRSNRIREGPPYRFRKSLTSRPNPMSLSAAIRLMNHGHTTRMIFYFRRIVAHPPRRFVFCDTAYARSPLPPPTLHRFLAICIFGVVNTSVAYRAPRPAAYFSRPVYKSVIQHAIKCSTRWKVGEGRERKREKEREVERGLATKEERRTTVVNRNYEAARLRICRAGSKRCCEMGRPRGIVRDVDALDHRREYSAPRFCSYMYIYIYIVYTFSRAPSLEKYQISRIDKYTVMI